MRTRQHIKTTVALALALSAIAAPAASAQPQTHSRQSASASPVVRPNPDQQTAVPTAANAGPRSEVVDGGGYRSPATPALSSTSTGPHSEVIDNRGYSFANVPPTIVRVIAPNSGFHWGDAGIGAAGALAILALGSAIAVSQRRARRSRGSSAVTS